MVAVARACDSYSGFRCSIPTNYMVDVRTQCQSTHLTLICIGNIRCTDQIVSVVPLLVHCSKAIPLILYLHCSIGPLTFITRMSEVWDSLLSSFGDPPPLKAI